MLLYHDLVIEGDGNVNFVFGGAMQHFDHATGFTKRGSSTVTLTGNNTFHGRAAIEGGTVILDGPNAAFDGASEVAVQAGARLTFKSGRIRTDLLDVSQGDFDFDGGTLDVQTVMGNLDNPNGRVIVGASAITSNRVLGDYSQTGGTLEAHLNGHQPGFRPLMIIDGQAQLSGELDVLYTEGNSIPVGSIIDILLASGGLTGTFTSIAMPLSPPGSNWQLTYTDSTVSLERLSDSIVPVSAGAADFNGDGVVDGADLEVWRGRFGTEVPVTADQRLDFGGHDFLLWQQSLGTGAQPAPASASIPEPTGVLIVAVGALIASASRRLKL
jgi:autotransporter-associated beta strand protein